MYRIDLTKEALEGLRELGKTHKQDAAEIFRVFQNASKSADINETLLIMGKYAGYEVKIYKEEFSKGRYIFILKAYRDDENTMSVSIRAFYGFNHEAKIVYVLSFFLRGDDSYEESVEEVKNARELYDKFCAKQV